MISTEQIREMLLDLENDRIERISPNGAEAKQKAIELGYLVEGKNQKPPQMSEKGQEEEQKRSDLTLPKFPTLLIKDVYDLLKMNRKNPVFNHCGQSWCQRKFSKTSDSLAQR